MTSPLTRSVKPASHPKPLRVGLDIGSTTVKAVVLDQSDSLGDTLFSDYRRHHANVRATVAGLLVDIHKEACGPRTRRRTDSPVYHRFRRSGAWLTICMCLSFRRSSPKPSAIDKEYPQADVIIELGGEDAKITYLKPTPEQRMNGSCAGGTGAFIDQMSTLLDTDAAGLNEMAKQLRERCIQSPRVAACSPKPILQPLINDGAAKPDLAASIFTAVATQTIAGLASGRPIHGTVIFLGGPLFFMSELRAAFQRALEGKVDEFIVPTDAHLYVALRLGAAGRRRLGPTRGRPAFRGPHVRRYPEAPGRAEEPAGQHAHHAAAVPDRGGPRGRSTSATTSEHVHIGTLEGAHGPHFLGIDAGSTTIKATLVNDDREIVWSSATPPTKAAR